MEMKPLEKRISRRDFIKAAGMGAAGVSLKTDIQPIFNEHCVVCHQGGSPPGGP